MGEIARGGSARGEVVLSRSDRDGLELRVNGVLVMSSAETSTEDLLAMRVLESLTAVDASAGGPPGAGLTVVVGGLGLGVTLARLLTSTAVVDVLVVEIEPDLVEWHHDGTVPPPEAAGPRSVLADPRVRVEVGDVRDCVSRLTAHSVDAVVLDVDNGPGSLVYDANSAVYEGSFLGRCAEALRPAGVLAVWSADEAPELMDAMQKAFDRVETVSVPVTLGRRETSYHLVVGHAPVGSDDAWPAQRHSGHRRSRG
jgi:spermidine synthase